MTSTAELVSRKFELPMELHKVTGVRIHGDVGVSPVDTTTAHVVVTGSQWWFVWTHGGVERAVNYRHIVEFTSDQTVL